MLSRILITLIIACQAGEVAAEASRYHGLCEASAAAYLDEKRFAVASDETNRILIYERGRPEWIDVVDFEEFTGLDKSDLEGAAVVGKRIYWISSHSFNKDGEDKPKRKLLFATDITGSGSASPLKPVGKAYGALRDPLAKAAMLKPAEIDIEGLAAAPGGGLFIGFRSPLQDKKALVVRLDNPGGVIDAGEEPRFSPPQALDLGGRGIRSLERVDGTGSYLIVAGPVFDAAGGFALYRWSGKDGAPKLIEGDQFDKLIPEALLAVPGTSTVQVLSDDGKGCAGNDEKAPRAENTFRSIDIDVKP